jgi:hypothetical protein
MALAQDNGAYKQGLADQKTGQRLTAAQFAASHPGADGDDYPLYQAGRAHRVVCEIGRHQRTLLVAAALAAKANGTRYGQASQPTKDYYQVRKARALARGD